MVFKPNIKPYLILIFIMSFPITPIVLMKVLEIKRHASYFKPSDFWLILVIFSAIFFILWLELCATKIEVTENELIYTEHLIKKQIFPLDEIKAVKGGVGTIVILAKKKQKIEINLNSYSEKDLNELIQFLHCVIQKNKQQ